MNDNYKVGFGDGDGSEPDIYEIPYHYGRDDGKMILHVGDAVPVCADCGKGRLAWAEAGYTPWFRICDYCGSRWTIMVKQLGFVMPSNYLFVEPSAAAGMVASKSLKNRTMFTYGDERLEEIDMDAPAFESSMMFDDRPAPPWSEFARLLTKEHWLRCYEARGYFPGENVAVPICVARRARFYIR